MDRKKKKYFDDTDNVSLTNYVVKKMKKLERKQTSNIQVPGCIIEHDAGSNDRNNFHNIQQEVMPDHSEISTDDCNLDVLLHESLSVYGTPEKLEDLQLCVTADENEDDHEAPAESVPFLDESLSELNQISDFTFEDVYSSDDEVLEFLKKKSVKSKKNSLHELKNQQGFLESISTCVEQSPGEILLMSLKFALSSNLSITDMTNLFRLINCICGKSILPETRYMIDKLCDCDDDVILHSICPTCTKYIGTFGNVHGSIKCDDCQTNIDVSNPSNPCFFAVIDPSSTICDYLQSNENFYDYVIRERVHEKRIIKDIYDGKLYRNFVKNLPACDCYSYATVTFNSDGAPVFESSSFSIWPIYLCINEIPVQARFNSIIVVGLWFGKNKPEMSVFLEVFTKKMNQLSNDGVKCVIKKEMRCIKIYSILSCVDTIARATMNGSCQFNAHYGCDWCTHPGVYYGGSMRFPYLNPPSENRSVNSTILFAEEALRTGKPVFGIKTASPLLNLNGFDIIQGFIPEYMHHFLSGVAKQFTEYIINYISKNDYDTMNNLLSTIKAPHQLCRLARPLSDRADWKAREWENWVLYYSVPILSQVLKSKSRLQHWSLLTESLHIALQMNITYEELNRLNEMLHKFVSEAENLYDLKAMTYNTHQLLHLAESVKNWGPLWAHSTFCFESANHQLLRAIKCAKGVIPQIIRRINLQNAVQVLEKIVYPECFLSIQQLYKGVSSLKTKRVFKLTDITYFGKGNTIDELSSQKFNISKTAKVFSKFVMNGCLYMSSAKINARSCNYFSQLINGQFIKMNNFIVDSEKNEEITICQFIEVSCHKYSNAVKKIVVIQDEIMLVKTCEISRGAVFIKTPETDYIIAIPNLFFY